MRNYGGMANAWLGVVIFSFAMIGSFIGIECNKRRHNHNSYSHNYSDNSLPKRENNFSGNYNNNPLLYWRTDINDDGRKDSIIENGNGNNYSFYLKQKNGK